MMKCLQPLCKTSIALVPSTFLYSSHRIHSHPCKITRDLNCCEKRGFDKRKRGVTVSGFLPVDPWAPSIDSQSIAPQLFAASLFPYIGFLYFITKSKSAPKLTLFGFYFLLAFVGATIPAGIYAKVHYGTSLANVDWLHGGAESLLTLTNLFIVLGLRDALRKSKDEDEKSAAVIQKDIKDDKSSSV